MSAVKGNLLLDESTWDLELVNGNLVVSSGDDAVRQAIYFRLRFFKGEFFADESIGLLNFADMLGKKQPNLTAIREAFRAEILATPGVASVDSIDLRHDSGRSYSLSFVCTQDDGTKLLTDSFQLGVSA